MGERRCSPTSMHPSFKVPADWSTLCPLVPTWSDFMPLGGRASPAPPGRSGIPPCRSVVGCCAFYTADSRILCQTWALGGRLAVCLARVVILPVADAHSMCRVEVSSYRR